MATLKSGIKHNQPLPEIRGYQLTIPFSNTNSGFARWAFAKKEGKEYFIKEFLSPVCPRPSSNLSVETIQRKQAICDEFYKNKMRLYNAINESSTGNIITIRAFFFHDTKYYMVSDKVETAKITIKDIADKDREVKLLLLKVLSYCILSLHKNKVVHADLKPTNILVKQTEARYFTVKLIDYDGSFLVGEQPISDEIQGDLVYYAPEAYRVIVGEELTLSPKIDVFALGLLFHQYYTGKLPGIPKGYAYSYEAVIDGHDLVLENSIPDDLAFIIRSMLKSDPDKRPAMDIVCDALQTISNAPKTPSTKDGPWKRPSDDWL